MLIVATHLPSQRRQRLLLKPRVLLEPDVVAWRGVREGDLCGEQLLIIADGVGEGLVPAGVVVVQGVLADQDREPYVGHGLEQSGTPGRGALGSGWQVSTIACAGVAEAHRDERDQGGVVELFIGELQPFTQASAGGVVPGDAGLVGFAARRLADDEDA